MRLSARINRLLTDKIMERYVIVVILIIGIILLIIFYNQKNDTSILLAISAIAEITTNLSFSFT